MFWILGTKGITNHYTGRGKAPAREFNRYREFPRKPRPLAPRMNWQNNLKIT
jgi:hypothetical protein